MSKVVKLLNGKMFDYSDKCSENFRYGEFLPPDAHLYHENPAELVTPWLLRVSEALRSRYGAVNVNTWLWGGEMVGRGVRLEKGVTSRIGAKRSRHKIGLALDCTFKDVFVPTVRNQITKNHDEWLSLGVVRVETGTRWLHLDGGLYITTFNP